jgi:hypothetical protein
MRGRFNQDRPSEPERDSLTPSQARGLLARARIRAPFDGERIFLKHKVTQHHWQCEGQDWRCQGQDSRRGGLRTPIKTHTGKTSSLRPVGCISDQFPTRGILTTSLRLAHKSPPRTTSPRLRLVRGPWHTARAQGASTTTDARGGTIPHTMQIQQLAAMQAADPTRALMLAWPAARPSHRHHLPLCHTQAQQAPPTTSSGLDLGSSVAG